MFFMEALVLPSCIRFGQHFNNFVFLDVLQLSRSMYSYFLSDQALRCARASCPDWFPSPSCSLLISTILMYVVVYVSRVVMFRPAFSGSLPLWPA